METKVGQEISRGQSDSKVYSLEVSLLHDFSTPFKYSDMIIDHKWRQLSILKAPFGVPDGILDPLPTKDGYVCYDSAMALAYWFLAEAKYISVQVRLVEHKFVTTWSDTIVKELDPITGHFNSFIKDKK